MAETPEDPSSGLLSGWGEIAAYVRKSERCVQRWEHERQLPIHRDLTAKGQTVYAYRHEIDAWRAANDGPPIASLMLQRGDLYVGAGPSSRVTDNRCFYVDNVHRTSLPRRTPKLSCPPEQSGRIARSINEAEEKR